MSRYAESAVRGLEDVRGALPPAEISDDACLPLLARWWQGDYFNMIFFNADLIFLAATEVELKGYLGKGSVFVVVKPINWLEFFIGLSKIQ